MSRATNGGIGDLRVPAWSWDRPLWICGYHNDPVGPFLRRREALDELALNPVRQRA